MRRDAQVHLFFDRISDHAGWIVVGLLIFALFYIFCRRDDP